MSKYTSHIRVTPEAHAALRQQYARTGESLQACASRLIIEGATLQSELDRKVGAGLARVVGKKNSVGHSGDFDAWIVEDIETQTTHHVYCDDRPHWGRLV